MPFYIRVWHYFGRLIFSLPLTSTPPSTLIFKDPHRAPTKLVRGAHLLLYPFTCLLVGDGWSPVLRVLAIRGYPPPLATSGRTSHSFKVRPYLRSHPSDQ
jgi:hypothetical protein